MSDGLGALMDRAAAGDASANEQLAQHFQQLYPETEEGPGAGPPPSPFASPWSQTVDWAASPTVAEADAKRGVPPGPEHYSLPHAVDRVPEASGLLRDWAFSARMSVDDVAEIGREVERLAHNFGHIPDDVLGAMGRDTAERLKSTREGAATLDAARAHWRRIESRHPNLAELLAYVGGAADEAFLRLLARTWRA